MQTKAKTNQVSRAEKNPRYNDGGKLVNVE